MRIIIEAGGNPSPAELAALIGAVSHVLAEAEQTTGAVGTDDSKRWRAQQWQRRSWTQSARLESLQLPSA